MLQRRARWRRNGMFCLPDEAPYLSLVQQKVYAGEEVPRCLHDDDVRVAAKHAAAWAERRNPKKAQYDAKESDLRKFEEEQRQRGHQAAVSYRHSLLTFVN